VIGYVIYQFWKIDMCNSETPDVDESSYAFVRSQIKTGDIVMFRGNTWDAKFISFFTGSPYSHCGVAMWCSDIMTSRRRLMLIESNIGGVRLISLSSNSNVDFDVLPGFSKTEWNFVEPEISSMIGSVDYGYMDFVTVFLREKLGIKLKDPKGQICSEFVAKILSQFSKQYRGIGGSQSPAKLYDNLISLGAHIKATSKGAHSAS